MKKIFGLVTSLEEFNTLKIAADESNTAYTINDGEQTFGEPDIKWEQVVFIENEGLTWTHGKIYGKPAAKSLVLGEGLVKTSNDSAISISIDKEFLKSYIDEYINNFVDSNWTESGNVEEDIMTEYNVFANVLNYVLDNKDYNWYDFTFSSSNIVLFNEPTGVPTSDNNFGNKYVPSYTTLLSKPLNLEKTPYACIEYFTMNSCPVNFKFVDANGKCSAPIAVGIIGSGSTKLYFDTSTRQGVTDKVISSIGSVGYTNYTGKDQIRNYVENTLVPEYESAGKYAKNTGKSDVINILTDMENGFSNSFEDEGFDRTKITAICWEFVEHFDKEITTNSYKEREKAVIFNKFIFTASK